MGPKTFAAAVLALLAIGVGSAGAHHSVAGQFDNSRRAKITGTISKIDWINPHTYIYLDVKSDKGEVTTWRLESLPTAMLRKAGLTSEKLISGGATVTADALMARDGSAHLAWLLKLTYEDGHFFQLAGE
ncbi:MAG: DUF6152 family protein [Gammaproteobacteria bacterium]